MTGRAVDGLATLALWCDLRSIDIEGAGHDRLARTLRRFAIVTMRLWGALSGDRQ